MSHLEQAARIFILHGVTAKKRALNPPQRRILLFRFYKRPLKILLPERDHWLECCGAAHAARLSVFDMHRDVWGSTETPCS